MTWTGSPTNGLDEGAAGIAVADSLATGFQLGLDLHVPSSFTWL